MTKRTGAWRQAPAMAMLLLLAACGGGGGGGGTTGPLGGDTILSAAGRAWVEPASAGDAAAAAPDGMAVELQLVSATGTTVLARTAVQGGRYAFSNVARPAEPAAAAVLVQLQAGPKPLRTLAAPQADVSPASEAVIASLDAQALGAGQVTPAEFGAMRSAADTLAELARAEPAAPLRADADGIAQLLRADAAFDAYRREAQAPGSTARGIGDVGLLYPAEIGRRWQYVDVDPASNANGMVQPWTVAAQEAFGGRPDALKFVLDPLGAYVYRAKDLVGVYGLGNGATDTLTAAVQRAIGPQLQVPFPLPLGSTRQTGSVGNTVLPADLDGDGRNETFTATHTTTVHGVEVVDTPAGRRAAVKVTNTLQASATLSADRSVGTLEVTDTFWLVRGIGVVRSESRTRVVHPRLNTQASQQLALLAYAGPGQPLQFAGGELRAVPLMHLKLVADPPRRRVLALLFGADVTQGRALAMVDVDSGAVRYSSGTRGPVWAPAVAPDGTVFAAVNAAVRECGTQPTILQFNAQTLALERSFVVPRLPGAFCEAGNVTHIEALSAGTLIVQTDGSNAPALVRLDNGVLAPKALQDFPQVLFQNITPISGAFVYGARIYMVGWADQVVGAEFGADGLGATIQLGTYGSQTFRPWLDGHLLRSQTEAVDLVSGLTLPTPAGLEPCRAAEVPGWPSLGACTGGRAYTMGRFRLLDLALGQLLAEIELPWSAARDTTLPDHPVMIDTHTFVASGRESFLQVSEWDQVFLVRRR